MVIKDDQLVDLPTPYGPMQTAILRPAAEGKYPGLILYSEIFQITAPIRRTAAFLAGHGFVVAVPEVYHELEEKGTVLAYDQAGSDRGNHDKYEKELASYDADSKAVIQHLLQREDCTGKVGAMGICLGGHLAFRAALNPEVHGTVCFYATDLHSGTLGKGKQDDSLARASEIKGELFHVWGRQDPHVPLDGRNKIKARLDEAGVTFQWLELNGAHAFLRDEGYRYDPELAYQALGMAVAFLNRRLK